ncbi:MAG: malic enzyme-like NAD(P)-binding protein, partial [bacterium]
MGRRGGVFSVETNLRRLDSRLLSVIYTPGVAEPCRRIAEDAALSFKYGGRGKTALLLSNGGSLPPGGNKNIYPLLEAHALLYKQLSGIDVYPFLTLASDEELIDIARRLLPTAGALIFENVSPGFSEKLQAATFPAMGVPAFQADLTGRAVASLALLLNLARREKCSISQLKIVLPDKTGEAKLLIKLLNLLGCEDNISRDNFMDADVVFVFNSAAGELEQIVGRVDFETLIVAGGWSEAKTVDLSGLKEIVTSGYGERLNCLSGFLVSPALLALFMEKKEQDLSLKKQIEYARYFAGLVSDERLAAGYLLPDPLDPAATVKFLFNLLKDSNYENKNFFLARLRQSIYERDPDYASGHIWEDFNSAELSELGARYYEVRKGPVNCSLRPRVADKESFKEIYRPGCLRSLSGTSEKIDEFDLTARSNLVAVATNGTAVLGLGDIGPLAARPVMEGKSALFKAFGGVNAIPLCIEDEGNSDIFIDIMKKLEGSLGGINLEDISAPDCFKIERQLKKELDIPVFHDDQHGTAIVILAGLQSAFSLLDRELASARVVINGAGAAGIAVANILRSVGIQDIILADSKGIIYSERENLNIEKKRVASWSNPDNVRGNLRKALQGADVFIGLSIGGLLSTEDIGLMNKRPVVFALANPEPEIYPEQAYRGGAAVVATGRSDFPNQVNNVMAFPGVFRGALDVRATD